MLDEKKEQKEEKEDITKKDISGKRKTKITILTFHLVLFDVDDPNWKFDILSFKAISTSPTFLLQKFLLEYKNDVKGGETVSSICYKKLITLYQVEGPVIQMAAHVSGKAFGRFKEILPKFMEQYCQNVPHQDLVIGNRHIMMYCIKQILIAQEKKKKKDKVFFIIHLIF